MHPTRRLRTVRILSRSPRATSALAIAGPLAFACRLGRAGRSARKREGDGATPTGSFAIIAVYWRPDRLRRPLAPCPVLPIRRDMGWCDALADRNYNRPVRLPYTASTETMWRADRLYDVVVVLDHNHRPRIRGRGSAIFMHVARPGLLPTEGCIALPAARLVWLLACLGRGARIVIA